ncbi:MAG: aminopeptidase N, partial [Stackebrandtia sp.]
MAVTHNLTREESAERARLLDVASYAVTLDLAQSDATFASRTEVRFACAEPGAATFVEIAAESIERAVLNGEPVDVSAYSPETGLRLTGLDADNTLVVEATIRYSDDGQGLHRLVDPVDGETYLYTHFESADAQRMYACFDQTDLKARFELTVTLPERWKAISNMPVTEESVDSGTKTVRFAQSPRMSTFITALCAGPYHEVRRVHDGIDLGLYCRASMAEHLDADPLFTLTGQLFDHYHSHFEVRYPLPKYDQVAVPEYNAGATENFGCVVFAEQLFVFRSQATAAARQRRASVIAHEMAHMWFGNLVTPRWWDELWLKESFATWAACWAMESATEFTRAWTTFQLGQKNAAHRDDELSTTHPIRGDIPDVFYGLTAYDAITYQKGASVLKQLAAYVGVEAFCAGLRAYFKKHQLGTAGFDDLKTALEAASGRDLSGWAGQWLDAAGHNTLRPEFDDAGRLTIVQESPAEHPTPRDHRLAVGLYDLHDGKLRRRRRVELDVSGERTPVPQLDGEPRADVTLINDDDLTFARTRLDERSLLMVRERLRDFEEAMPRALCVSIAWDMTRRGDLAPLDFVGMIAAATPSEDNISLADTAQAFVALVVNLYLPAEALPQAHAALARAALGVLDSAEP